jgi:hypothetical protein
MLRARVFAIALAVSLLSCSIGQAADLGYDPQADPFEQYHDAVAQAQAEHKLVLIVAGGDWCTWCHALSRFVERNADVDTKLHDAFVVIKVYVGDENYNADFFSQLPEARGAPHFWIVSPERHVLSSQSLSEFEAKKGYDKGQFMDFIQRWKAYQPELHAAR